MNEFYEVSTCDGDDFFFKSRDKAHEYLWQYYLNTCSGNESDEDIANARKELDEFSEIQSVGYVYTVGFED